MGDGPQPELTFCVVATAKRELLGGCLDAIARERETLPFATETLVLDNCSRDGSAELARAHPAVDETIALRPPDAARGPTTRSCWRARRAATRCCSTRTPSCARARRSRSGRRCEEHPGPRSPGRACCAPTDVPSRARGGSPRPRARWRSRSGCSACWSSQSRGGHVREVDWCQSSALLVRREAAAAGGLPRPRLLRLLGRGRLRPAAAGCRLGQPVRPRRARPCTTSSSPTTPSAAGPRIVELARNRDLYMRKHHSPAAARAVRWLTAAGYAERALAALVLPGHSPRRYWSHVEATLPSEPRGGTARGAPNASTPRWRRRPRLPRRGRPPRPAVDGRRARPCGRR